ncbi:MAG: hypothetical protein O9289_19630 [Rhodobacteraceae bacterium]|jgi:hypothetical protein|nr:hypothetical protein [Paracoccaceae bacterium]MCZ8085417.1 hypothetical protein [Paracoccaceae bacterium]
MMAWEVQHHTLCQGWINTWSEEVDGVSRPLTYPSEAAAQDALEEFLREIAEEIAYGERDPDQGYDSQEFRVVEVTASAET